MVENEGGKIGEVKVESAKATKPVPALAAKKEVAPKAPLINSVFNLARHS